MYGNEMIILPFGVMPVVFFIAYIFWVKAEEKGQKSIGSKIRKGITEFPDALSGMLHDSGGNSLVFSEDGRSLLLTLDPTYASITQGYLPDLSEHDAVKAVIEEKYRSMDEPLRQMVAKEFIVEAVEWADIDKGRVLRARVTLPDSVIRSDVYVDYEMVHLGSVFTQNLVGNNCRYLIDRPQENRVERANGKTLVYVDRHQYVPGFLDSIKCIVMSERQITHNIRNRLWGRFDVHCISIDQETFCGELVPLES